MDTTYKTNRFGLYLVNLVGVSANNESFFMGSAFINDEGVDVYKWVLRCFKDVLIETQISLPRIILIDATIGLANAIIETLPQTTHLLCLWHINKAMIAWLKVYWKPFRRRIDQEDYTVDTVQAEFNAMNDKIKVLMDR